MTDFSATEKASEVKSMGDAEAARRRHETVQLVAASSHREAHLRFGGKDLSGNFQEAFRSFLLGEATEKDHELFREGFRGAEGCDWRDPVVNHDRFVRRRAVVLKGDPTGVSADGDNQVSFLEDTAFLVVNPFLFATPGAIITE